MTVATSRVRAPFADPLIRNSALMMLTTVSMAGAGAVFWVVAARLTSPTQLGLASSLVATTEALAVFAQLGLNVSLLHVLPRSDRKRADVRISAGAVVLTAAVLAVGYGAALPILAPDLAAVITWSVLPLFALLVAGAALNQLTDCVFLGIDRVRDNLVINGVLLSATRIVVPFALAGAGALTVFGAIAGPAVLAAAVSLWLIARAVRQVPGSGPARWRPSRELRDSVGLSGAGYATSVLYLAPQLVFPVLIIGASGPAQSAIFFLGFQVVTLLNHAVYMISNSMYAEVARAPHRVREIVGRAGRTIAVVAGAGIVTLVFAAPVVLAVFGRSYADAGATTLRVLALGTAGVALNYWSGVRLRIARHHRAMVGVQSFATVAVVGLAAIAAPHGIAWVAAAWGTGQLLGGVVGYVISRTIAPLPTTAPAGVGCPEPVS